MSRKAAATLWTALLASALLAPIANRANAAQPGDEPPLIVEDMQCKGNATLSCRYLLGHVFLSPGEVLDEKEIQNAELRLTWIPSVEAVDIYLERGSEKGKVIVVVEVVEGSAINRELAIGFSHRLDSSAQTVAARFTHQNLFGTGKVLDLQMRALTPVNGPPRRSYGASLSYTDPHFLDRKRLFFVANLYGANGYFAEEQGDFLDVEYFGMSAALAVRVFDFTYIGIGHFYRPVADIRFVNTEITGRIATGGHLINHGSFVTYGWQSEDDPYFPTHGSRLLGSLLWNSRIQDEYGFHFRKTWTVRGSFLSIRTGETPGSGYGSSFDEDVLSSIGFARPIAPNSLFGGTTRGRWYVEAGGGMVGWTRDGEKIKELGIKAGVRLDTKTFGIVDFYVIGSKDYHTGGNAPGASP